MRWNESVANQRDHHEEPQPARDFYRETPKLSPAAQLGAAVAPSVPLNAVTTTVLSSSSQASLPLREGHTQNYLFSGFMCVP